MKLKGIVSGLSKSDDASTFTLRSSDGRDTHVQTTKALSSQFRNGDSVEVEGDMPPDPPFLATSVTKLGGDNGKPSGIGKWVLLGALSLAAVGGYYWLRPSKAVNYRLELESNSRYLKADQCSDRLILGTAPDAERPDCEQWQQIRDSAGYSRYQLKHNKLFLTIPACLQGGRQAVLAAKQTDQDAVCQLWRIVPDPSGWSRLQLKHGGEYLDADHCRPQPLALNPGPGGVGGVCQLWRLVP
jgi:hypothetical protein